LPGRSIEFNGTEFRVFMKSPDDEHYFGLGDKPGPLDRRNEAFTDWNTDAFGWQESTDPIYKSIPYFMTFRKGEAAGVFLDNTWRASFEFNKEYRNGYSFGSESGPLDFYILYGPEPKAGGGRVGMAGRARRRCRRSGRWATSSRATATTPRRRYGGSRIDASQRADSLQT
jgi:alpha-glucosidase (family GH31 glycosyl hydrolase)